VEIPRLPFQASGEENGFTNTLVTVYVVELALRMSPMPISVQRKESADADSVYQQVRQALEQGQPRLLELTCEKVEGKRLSVLTSDVLAVQTYEKTAASGGSKRPGFSLEN
jgi:hypothetical protein